MAYEDFHCTDCDLHKKCKSVCLPSVGGIGPLAWKSCKLAIFLDYPNYLEDRKGVPFISDAAEFVWFCLRRMSVPREMVYLDYILKCAPGKLPGVKSERMGLVAACSQYRVASLQDMPSLGAVVVLGGLGCEAITGEKRIGAKTGAEWKPMGPYMQAIISHVWVGYSPGLLREKPSEAGSIFRVIWKAAEEAGLSPAINTAIKPYDFEL